MKINNYPAALTVSLFFLVTLPISLAAQSSLTMDSTAGIFSNDIDAFMDPNDWDTIEFNSYFLAFRHSTIADAPLAVGFASNLGTLYTGLYYSGNITEYRNDNPGTTVYTSVNNLALLLGSPSFGGIKLGLDLDIRKMADKQNIYTVSGGWGKNFELNNGTTLKPEVNASYMFPSTGKIDFGRFGGDLPFDAIPVIFSILSNYSIKNAFSGSIETDWVLEPKGTTERMWTLGYGLSTAIVEREPRSGTITKSRLYNHFAWAKYKQIYNLSEKFSAGFSAGAAFDFLKVTEKYTYMGITMYGFVEITNEISISTYTFIPEASAAFTYKFDTPFSVNAGLDLTYPITRFNYSNSLTAGLPGFSVLEITYDGINAAATAGGSFEPYPGLAIDFSWTGGYYEVDMGVITLAVRIRK